ncbi:10889_t:CDS:2, partial [Gigaspora rosea]
MADTSALNAQIIRGLNDRVYEKRKAAALEVEKLIREHTANKEPEKIKAILNKLVSDFAGSQQANSRNGGLIGLAAASIALGPNVAVHLDEIVPPVLACFSDQDSRVRYYACESMYNIAKVSKGEILRYFNEVFDAMSKLAADSEVSVKNGTELLDRLIKDI